MTLRANTGGTVQKMDDAIWFSFLHVSSNEKHQHHSLRDKSWCQYRRDEANNTNLFKHGPGLPNEVVALVKPIYKNLIKHEELSKCRHGKTHNQNESFNALIWERAPKNFYLSLETLRFAVYDAVAVFSDGRQGSLNVLKSIGVQPGYYTTELCCMLNLKRKLRSSNRVSETTRIRRRVLRAQKKKKSTEKKGVEGKSYKTGGFRLLFNSVELCDDRTVGSLALM